MLHGDDRKRSREQLNCADPMLPVITNGSRNFAHAIAKEMGLPDFSVEGLWLAAYVYDISLVNMPVLASFRIPDS